MFTAEKKREAIQSSFTLKPREKEREIEGKKGEERVIAFRPSPSPSWLAAPLGQSSPRPWCPARDLALAEPHRIY